jgi:abortive infection bacteriophage resistance protein
MGGAFSVMRCRVKPSLSWDAQVSLLQHRGLVISDVMVCRAFLAATNYYRFSGYARYFQQAPHLGDDSFRAGATFDVIRTIYEADTALRSALAGSLAHAEVLLRAHTAYVVAQQFGPCSYLDDGFYTDAGSHGSPLEACVRDIERSRERHILHFASSGPLGPAFTELPIWSAVDAWSFGTLSRCIEQGAQGQLADAVATSLGLARAGFSYRVRSLVYLRNRCAHHSRLWHHSVVDAGPTPHNVRTKAKRAAGQFEPRSVLDVVASLDDAVARGGGFARILPVLVDEYAAEPVFWEGLAHPRSPRDHVRE